MGLRLGEAESARDTTVASPSSCQPKRWRTTSTREHKSAGPCRQPRQNPGKAASSCRRGPPLAEAACPLVVGDEEVVGVCIAMSSKPSESLDGTKSHSRGGPGGVAAARRRGPPPTEAARQVVGSGGKQPKSSAARYHLLSVSARSRYHLLSTRAVMLSRRRSCWSSVGNAGYAQRSCRSMQSQFDCQRGRQPCAAAQGRGSEKGLRDHGVGRKGYECPSATLIFRSRSALSQNGYVLLSSFVDRSNRCGLR